MAAGSSALPFTRGSRWLITSATALSAATVYVKVMLLPASAPSTLTVRATRGDALITPEVVAWGCGNGRLMHWICSDWILCVTRRDRRFAWPVVARDCPRTGIP